MINKPPDFKGLPIGIPITIPIKGRGFMTQAFGLNPYTFQILGREVPVLAQE